MIIALTSRQNCCFFIYPMSPLRPSPFQLIRCIGVMYLQTPHAKLVLDRKISVALSSAADAVVKIAASFPEGLQAAVVVIL